MAFALTDDSCAIPLRSGSELLYDATVRGWAPSNIVTSSPSTSLTALTPRRRESCRCGNAGPRTAQSVSCAARSRPGSPVARAPPRRTFGNRPAVSPEYSNYPFDITKTRYFDDPIHPDDQHPIGSELPSDLQVATVAIVPIPLLGLQMLDQSRGRRIVENLIQAGAPELLAQARARHPQSRVMDRDQLRAGPPKSPESSISRTTRRGVVTATVGAPPIDCAGLKAAKSALAATTQHSFDPQSPVECHSTRFKAFLREPAVCKRIWAPYEA
jgi:transcriptional regulator of met regulon